MNRQQWGQALTHLLLALGISGILLALLMHSTIAPAQGDLLPRLLAVATSVAPLALSWYLLAVMARTFLQTLRYQAILAASEPQPPGFFHVLLVTVSRNMFVDMLPSRLGELSYVAMLNRGYAVGVPACLSSLALGFVFDLLALALLLAAIIIYQFLQQGVEGWLVATFGLVSLVFVVALFLLFPGLQRVAHFFLAHQPKGQGLVSRALQRLVTFTATLAQSFTAAKKAGLVGRLVLLSLGIRLGKYLGLYALFCGVVATAFPGLRADFAMTLVALISAEAGASLPLPAFMGFGTYEAGGMLALVALGADKAESLLIMLALHVLSQIIDYSCGGLAVLGFAVTTRSRGQQAQPSNKGHRWSWYTITVVLLAVLGCVFLAVELRGLLKRGSLRPPDQGHAVAIGRGEALADKSLVSHLSGFVVWSSNRSGHHDLWRYRFPEGTISPLTTDPHTETWPRISPDGREVIFARSVQPWVSQRSNQGWNVLCLTLATGQVRLLAKDGKTPSWSADGRHVFFQRQGHQVVQVDVATGRETVLLQTGGKQADLPGSVLLETPSISATGEIALTLRGSMRVTGVLTKQQGLLRMGDGCQLAWAPGDSFLYKVDHGGHVLNALYRIDPRSRQAVQWFDAPRPYSHEYFPRLDSTGTLLVYGASTGDHEHDTADYEIFLWQVGTTPEHVVRLTHHTGNDCWPDIHLDRTK